MHCHSEEVWKTWYDVTCVENHVKLQSTNEEVIEIYCSMFIIISKGALISLDSSEVNQTKQGLLLKILALKMTCNNFFWLLK